MESTHSDDDAIELFRILPGNLDSFCIECLTIFFRPSDFWMLSVCLRTSFTVDICIAAALIVGRYPMLSSLTVTSLLVTMLKTVQLLID